MLPLGAMLLPASNVSSCSLSPIQSGLLMGCCGIVDSLLRELEAEAELEAELICQHTRQPNYSMPRPSGSRSRATEGPPALLYHALHTELSLTQNPWQVTMEI